MRWILALGVFLITPVLSAQSKKILFLGDSITAGYGVDQKNAYPALVVEQLKAAGHPVEMINGSISGSLTATATSRLRWYLKAKPDILVLALGGNDAIKATPVEVIKKNLATCIELAQSHHIRVVLAGFQMFPNYGKEYADGFKQLYIDLAHRYKIEFIPFLLAGVGGEPSLNQADGKHPNEKGHAKIADLVRHKLESLL